MYRDRCSSDLIVFCLNCIFDQINNRPELAVEPIHIFYKVLLLDENNIFTANLTKKNKAEGVKLKKSKEYAVTGLSIDQDVDSDLVAVTDTDR